jgi:hypothetical protein
MKRLFRGRRDKKSVELVRAIDKRNTEVRRAIDYWTFVVRRESP